MIITDLRELSLVDGLIPPDGLLSCGCDASTDNHKHLGLDYFDLGALGELIGKVDAPSIVELELSSRTHRWKEIRSLMTDFFNATMQLVTDAEVDILQALNLPSIEEVRSSVVTGNVPDDETKWQFTQNMARDYRDILERWQYRFIGDPVIQEIKQVDEGETEEEARRNSVYTFYLLAAVGAATPAFKKLFKRRLPDEMPADLVDNVDIMPTLDNPYLSAIQREGMKRVKRKFSRSSYDKAMRQLERMAREGRNPLEVGRWIHKNVGEGQGWYWNRITRSESALATNVVYNEMADRTGVLYDEWSGSPNMCRICAMFDGQIWKRGESPEPVTDSHPHCLCILVPNWVEPEDKPVRQRWDRESPYDRPYSGESGREELSRLEQYFNS